jgi:hypothetical protein
VKRTIMASVAVIAAAVTLAPTQALGAPTAAQSTPDTSTCFWFGPTFTVSDPSLNYAFRPSSRCRQVRASC